jgi:hypothetical protein
MLTRTIQAQLNNLYPNDRNLEFVRLKLNSQEMRINTKRGMQEVRCGDLYWCHMLSYLHGHKDYIGIQDSADQTFYSKKNKTGFPPFLLQQEEQGLLVQQA